ncbi:HTH domain-containing protein [Streptomyces sp. Amel2xC10]|uniref:HTH domain-containing protein n=1 Tax=Streptomyces sp. Amel2xC10 TaxID=1305826 RepID=UPI000A083A3D|nr:HTH domain-containing protein [Streptomyces sp. Amel2xC10]SMF86445.1 HTH domain-containing protein [Streptomyces sp. Amel2xC10]
MPAPLTIAARRAMVEELRRQEPGISSRKIAARLGVGKDTIIRDIDEIKTAQRQRAAEAAAAAQESAPPAPETVRQGDTVVLHLDEPMRQALAVLRAKTGSPDTPAHNQAVARAAIRSVADSLAERGGQP